ncbi:MAG TPA: hypothetical protein ENL41_00465 [candidate division WOR-3 bacterium]|uniref:Uncharacterized protein n=1 Tax=candidate division WOR-3 bacterium TaxID=2052148 RepID=A0A7C5I488_UNCW3|nr:hypothetical protein [candidate division WOR-3 bacterium]
MRTAYILPIVSILTITTSAYALTVTPISYYTTVEPGTYDMINFHITNDANQSVNVTIIVDPELQGKVSFSSTSFTIPANSTKTITAVISRNQPMEGNIYINNITIPIKVNQTQQQPQPQSNFSIIPPQPVAGKNIIVLIPEDEDTTGYIYILNSNNAYLITISDGVGSVHLEKDDYGTAIINVKGQTKTISILPPHVDNLYIDFPSSIKTGDNITFTVYADGDPVSAKLKFDGADSFVVKTNSFGKATVKFRKAGNYTVTVSYFDNIVIKSFTVFSKPLEIQLPSEINTGTAIQIKTEPNAQVTIKKDETSWSYTANADGVCFFTPPFTGRYTVTAKTEDKEGSATFTVKTDTRIVATGIDGGQISKLKEGDIVILQILDSEDKPVLGSEIDVYVDGVFYKSLTTIGGTVVWKVDKFGQTYEFRFNPNNDEYLSSALTLMGEKQLDYFPVAIAGVIIAGAVGIYVAYQKGWLKFEFSKNKSYKDLF